MKRIFFVILALMLAAAVSGCHRTDHSVPAITETDTDDAVVDTDDSVSVDGDTDTDDDGGIVAMSIGVEYEVFEGDRIEADGAEAPVVSVRHVSEGDRKYVTLLSGSALLNPADTE